MTLSQTIILERLQAKALKAIYGYDQIYRELMEKASLTTLRARRDARELTFARKCAASERFPVNQVVRQTRVQTVYEESYARTHRSYNSPVFSMRRKLNRDIVEEGVRKGRAAEGLQTGRA